jgi:integrase
MKYYTYQIKSGPNAGRWAGYILIKGKEGQKDEKPTKYGKDEKEVLQKLAKLELEIENGDYIPRNTDTFVDFLKEYHRSCAGYDMWNPKSIRRQKKKWEETTEELYKMYIDVHFKPYFKEMKLKSVTPLILDEFYNYKLNNNENRPQKMGINTIIKLNKFLSPAFNYAIKNHKIKSNPSKDVILGEKIPFEPDVYEEDQFLQLWDYVKDKYDRVPISLGAGFGFRRGEIFGLRWENINFEQKSITIIKTQVRFLTQIEKGPKNNNSKRTVIGPDYVFDVLKNYKDEVMPTNEQEKILHVRPDYYSHRFQWLLDKFNMPHTTLHGLRHYNAYIMMDRGIPDKVAADRLGHDVNTLKSTYQHVKKKLDSKAANAIDDMFNKKI